MQQDPSFLVLVVENDNKLRTSAMGDGAIGHKSPEADMAIDCLRLFPPWSRGLGFRVREKDSGNFVYLLTMEKRMA